MKKSHFSQLGWMVSLFFIVLYLICLGWGYLLADAELMTLHQQLVALTFPGFVWFSWGSFIWGLVLSFVYGWVGAGIFVGLEKICCGEKGGCCK